MDTVKRNLYRAIILWGPIVLGAAISLYLSCYPYSTFALEPPPSDQVAALRGTEEFAQRQEFAKRLGNHKVDTFILKKAILNQQRKLLQQQGKSMDEVNIIAPLPAPPPDWRGMPSTGNVRVLSILIEFNDIPHTTSQADIHNNLFGAGNPARNPYESLARYYARASYNHLNLSNGATLGWYQTTYPRSSVPQTTAGRENLIKEALSAFENQGHDFSQYDNNGDGVIDYLMVFWTGPDNGWANFWWGYQTSFSDTAYSLDGVILGKYSWQWEANPVGSAFNPQVVIHETGHALGLPDYYDYDPAVGPRGGVGGLDMMDANKGDHSCFNKWMLEWVAPTFVANGTVTKALSASGDHPECVIVWPAVMGSDLFSEFFAIQNSHRVGNDHAPGMPGDGILIWHLDAQLTADGRDFANDNSYSPHKLIRLMEADGLEQIEAGAAANSADYYVTGKHLGPTTTPSSKRYDGSDTTIEVFNLSAAAPQMSATFRIGSIPRSDLFLYRAGQGAAWMAHSNKNGTFTGIYTVGDNGSAPPNGIAGYDLLSPDDRVLAFDYDGNGRDDFFLYRPGKGAAWVARPNGDGTFTGVHTIGDNGGAPPNGIAGYDLLSPDDRVLAFDYNGDGKEDLFLYRPGKGAAWVARSNGDGTFTGVHTIGDNGGAPPNGIAGYDLLSAHDQVIAIR